MNKVISREYVEKNYIHKDVIRKVIDEKDEEIKKFNEFVKDSTGLEKEYWKKERAELIGARNVLLGFIAGGKKYANK